MKKTFTSIAALLVFSGSALQAQAQDFIVPEPTFTVPLYGQAELLYNMFQITWGYYELVDNAGEAPITCSLTMPDGTVKTVKGIIDDANMEGTQEGMAPSTVDNALSFRNFMQLDESTMQYIQEYGTYHVNIPEGMVLVNGVPNPEVNLDFTINGVQEIDYMPKAQMVFPTSAYISFASAIQMYWPNQEIYFVEDITSVELEADVDGKSVGCNASIQTVEGGNEDGTDQFSMEVLYIVFDDFISYTDGTYLTVMIPEGLVANADGEVNELQTVELTLLPQIEASLSPADGTTLNSKEALITVNWEGISLQPLQSTTIVARNTESREDETVDVSFGNDASITLDLSTLSEGEYEIIIPEAFVTILTKRGAITDDYAINSEIFATYKIVSGSDSVEELKSKNGVYKIYSIDGKSIFNTADVSVLKDLRKGIYIINGKTVIIR